MSLVTVKQKFQVTIPARLRKSISLHEGDIVEASLVEGGILLRPKTVVDRHAAATKIESIFNQAPTPKEDIGRPQQAIMDEIIADISDARKQNPKPKA